MGGVGRGGGSGGARCDRSSPYDERQQKDPRLEVEHVDRNEDLDLHVERRWHLWAGLERDREKMARAILSRNCHRVAGYLGASFKGSGASGLCGIPVPAGIYQGVQCGRCAAHGAVRSALRLGEAAWRAERGAVPRPGSHSPRRWGAIRRGAHLLCRLAP